MACSIVFGRDAQVVIYLSEAKWERVFVNRVPLQDILYQVLLVGKKCILLHLDFDNTTKCFKPGKDRLNFSWRLSGPRVVDLDDVSPPVRSRMDGGGLKEAVEGVVRVGISYLFRLCRILRQAGHQEGVAQGVYEAYTVLLQIGVAIVRTGRPARCLSIDWSTNGSEVMFQYLKQGIYFMVKRLVE